MFPWRSPPLAGLVMTLEKTRFKVWWSVSQRPRAPPYKTIPPCPEAHAIANLIITIIGQKLFMLNATTVHSPAHYPRLSKQFRPIPQADAISSNILNWPPAINNCLKPLGPLDIVQMSHHAKVLRKCINLLYLQTSKAASAMININVLAQLCS